MSTQMRIEDLYRQLAELNRLAKELKDQLDDTETKTERVQVTMARALTGMNTVLMILRRLGLPEDAQQAIRVIQDMVHLMQTFYIVSIAVGTAAGPVNWIMLLGGLASMSTPMYDMLRGY